MLSVGLFLLFPLKLSFGPSSLQINISHMYSTICSMLTIIDCAGPILHMWMPHRGLRDEALSEACGVPGCVFVHASGFIGGNATYEGALAMARKSLAFQEGMTDELVGIST